MKAPVDSVPETRVCRDGCRGDEAQPIANFYKGALSANGIQLFSHVCKPCVIEREKKRYHARAPEERGRKREAGQLDPDDSRGMTDADFRVCKDCGLRGHMPGDEDRCSVAQRRIRPTGLGARGADWGLT